ncbi:hypothetical protein PCE1_003918 [Barthelona sp. PCE]
MLKAIFLCSMLLACVAGLTIASTNEFIDSLQYDEATGNVYIRYGDISDAQTKHYVYDGSDAIEYADTQDLAVIEIDSNHSPKQYNKIFNHFIIVNDPEKADIFVDRSFDLETFQVVFWTVILSIGILLVSVMFLFNMKVSNNPVNYHIIPSKNQ